MVTLVTFVAEEVILGTGCILELHMTEGDQRNDEIVIFIYYVCNMIITNLVFIIGYCIVFCKLYTFTRGIIKQKKVAE